jgi:ubiquitin-like-conjugating enzyme ATG10
MQEALRPDVDGSVTPPQYSLHSHQPYVTYEIHLHPTYSMPTLWFTLHDLPMGEPTFDLDSVYRYLVPAKHKSRLRAAGVTGGISAAVSFLFGRALFLIVQY